MPHQLRVLTALTRTQIWFSAPIFAHHHPYPQFLLLAFMGLLTHSAHILYAVHAVKTLLQNAVQFLVIKTLP